MVVVMVMVMVVMVVMVVVAAEWYPKYGYLADQGG